MIVCNTAKAILNNDMDSVRQYEQDEKARVAYLHNIADLLTPGTFKDLASSAGSYSAGDNATALHTIKGIGLNYKKELRENPAEFAMNAASVILPVGGAAFKAAVDMDKLAAAYSALKDVKMAQKAQAWAKVYRERVAMNAAEKPAGLSMGRSRASSGPLRPKSPEIHIGPDKPYPNIGNEGTLIGPRPIGLIGRWTKHDYTELVRTNERGQMIGFGKLGPGHDAMIDPEGNIMINDSIRHDPDEVVNAVLHELGHRHFTAGGRPGLVRDVRALIGQYGAEKSHALRLLEETLAEMNTGASWSKSMARAIENAPKDNPISRLRAAGEVGLGAGGVTLAGEVIGDAANRRRHGKGK